MRTMGAGAFEFAAAVGLSFFAVEEGVASTGDAAAASIAASTSTAASGRAGCRKRMGKEPS
jgi:hypothetical protein